MVRFSKKDSYSYSGFFNPYSGKVLHVRNNDRDFLSLVWSKNRKLKRAGVLKGPCKRFPV
jgi:hypothetical protein